MMGILKVITFRVLHAGLEANEICLEFAMANYFIAVFFT